MASFFDSSFKRPSTDGVECEQSYKAPELPARGSAQFEPEQFVEANKVHLDAEALNQLSDPKRGFVKPEWEIEWIRTEKQLKELCLRLERAPIFCVDTETSSIKAVGDLSERLCLIQIGLPKHQRSKNEITFNLEEPGKTFLIDVIALENQAKRKEARDGAACNPLTPLKRAMEDPELPKIIHHQQFERGQFIKYGINIQGGIDTEVLAKELRDDLVSESLAAVALEVAGKLISKEQQKSAWDRRPLSEEQVLYAALDAELPFAVWGIMQWYHERIENDLEHDLGLVKKLEEPTSEPEAKDLQVELLFSKILEARSQHEELIEKSGVSKALNLISAKVAALEDRVKKGLLPGALDQRKLDISAQGGTPGPEVGFEYLSIYGSAYYNPTAIKKIDLEVLKRIDPSLVEEVTQYKVTKKSIEAVLKERGERKLLDQIWEEINQESTKPVEPKLKLSFAADEEKEDSELIVSLPEKLSIEDCLREISEYELTRLKILRDAGIGNELGFLRAKVTRYADVIFDRLAAKAKESGVTVAVFECAGGSVEYSAQPKREINAKHFADNYPEVAAKTLVPHATREAVQEALRNRGFDPPTVEKLTDAAFKPTGEWEKPKARIYPKYGLYYKGLEDDADTELKQAA